jgi:hypothetical protein
MNFAATLFAVLVALAGIALAGLAAVACYWSRVGRLVSDIPVKVVAGAIKLFAGYVSLRGAFEAGAQKDDWWNACVAGIVCIAVWEILEKVIDSRIKATEKLDKGELDRAKRQSELRTVLLTLFRRAVAVKTRRVRRQAQARGSQLRVAHVHNALTPQPHLDEILEALAVFFHQQLPPDLGQQHNFRVGVYMNRDGVMTPVHAVSLNNPGYNPFSSYQANRDRFRLDTTESPAHVVRCVQEQTLIIVEDCAAAEAQGRFAYFSSAQRTYLRSMAAYYLGEVCNQSGTMTLAALVVDTEATGFFREPDRATLGFVFREFGARIRLELDLIALLSPRG